MIPLSSPLPAPHTLGFRAETLDERPHPRLSIVMFRVEVLHGEAGWSLGNSSTVTGRGEQADRAASKNIKIKGLPNRRCYRIYGSVEPEGTPKFTWSSRIEGTKLSQGFIAEIVH